MSRKKSIPKESVQNALQPSGTPTRIENGLTEAIMGTGSFPFNQGVPGTAQVENVGTIFRNMRYYFISNMRQILSQAYCEIGLVQTICDVPVDDAMRGGVTITSKKLDEEKIEALVTAMDENDDLGAIAQAFKWNRLFGGAGLLILTEQDPETPLNIEAIGPDSKLEFRPVDMWELFFDMQNLEGYDPVLQDDDTQSEFFSYYGEKVHRSRVILLKGIEAPSFVRPRLRGWGFSVVETLVRSLNQYLKSTDLAFEVLDEFKIDIFKMKNLINTLMSQDGTNKVRQRVQLANWQKNYQNALVMDSEDEWDHKQLSFAGLGDVMMQIRMQVASDMRMPITKLFGISAAGFNSGEDDIEVYNGMVESQVRNKSKYVILEVLKLRAQQTFGSYPDDLRIAFQPLRVMSSEQEEQVKEKKFNRLKDALEKNAITLEEFRDACNKGKLMDIMLSDDALAELEQAREEAMEAAAEGGPGESNNPESETPKAKNSRLKNSALFDRKSYEASGGDAQIDERRQEFFKHPLDVGLWRDIEEISRRAYGTVNWKFVVWTYQKRGGKF